MVKLKNQRLEVKGLMCIQLCCICLFIYINMDSGCRVMAADPGVPPEMVSGAADGPFHSGAAESNNLSQFFILEGIMTGCSFLLKFMKQINSSSFSHRCKVSTSFVQETCNCLRLLLCRGASFFLND